MTVAPVPALHMVTDRRRLAPDARTPRDEVTALLAQIAAAIDAGVDAIHVRERDLGGAALTALVARAVQLAGGSPTRILVNERADVARAAGAAGVHLPEAGIAADSIRRFGPSWLVGRSIHGEGVPADEAACDYLFFGTVYPSVSKGLASGAGLDALRRAVERLHRPVIAIGGVDVERARACVGAGAHGVAAIGAFLPQAGRSLRLKPVVDALRDALRQH